MCGKSVFNLKAVRFLSWIAAFITLAIGIYMVISGLQSHKHFARYTDVLGNHTFYSSVCWGVGVVLICISIFGLMSLYTEGYGMLLVLTVLTGAIVIVMIILGVYIIIYSYVGGTRNVVRDRLSSTHFWKYSHLEKRNFFALQRELKCCGIFYWKEYVDGSIATNFRNYGNTTLPPTCCNTGCRLPKDEHDIYFLNLRHHLYDRGCMYVAIHHTISYILRTAVRLLCFGIVEVVAATIYWAYSCGVYVTYYYN